MFAAYGWPVTLTDEEISERLVALNAEQVAEEARGLIRWLRPEFQNPAGRQTVQKTMDIEPDEEEASANGKKPIKGIEIGSGGKITVIRWAVKYGWERE